MQSTKSCREGFSIPSIDHNEFTVQEGTQPCPILLPQETSTSRNKHDELPYHHASHELGLLPLLQALRNRPKHINQATQFLLPPSPLQIKHQARSSFPPLQNRSPRPHNTQPTPIHAQRLPHSRHLPPQRRPQKNNTSTIVIIRKTTASKHTRIHTSRKRTSSARSTQTIREEIPLDRAESR